MKQIKESDFSTELILMSKIYEYNYVKKKPIWYGRLKRCIRGKMTNGAMDRALTKMYDLGIIDSSWERIDKLWTRKFTIGHECVDFAEHIYKMLQESKRGDCYIKENTTN